MSSWNKNVGISRIPYDAFYCKTSTSGYGSNFFNFFMCYLFAKHHNQSLYLNDTINNISKSYHLILDTFQELPGIKYTSLQGITLQQSKPTELSHFIEQLPREIHKKEAHTIFRFSSSIQKQLDLLKKNLPRIDCGVHIRTGDKITTGEMKAIPLERYIQQLTLYQNYLNKDNLIIYLMTDSQGVLQKMQELKHPSWTIISLPSPTQNPDGHIQSKYNNLPTDIKMKSFLHFLAEIQVLQECPHVLCTFSSNIGRFIDLTKKEGTCESLD